jgi:hypothetical protein
MITGCLPFSSNTPENLAYKIINGDYKRIDKNGKYSDTLIDLVHSMLDKVFF